MTIPTAFTPALPLTPAQRFRARARAMLRITAAAWCAGGTVALAVAQPAPPAQPVPIPAMQHQGSAQWSCGGIGIDESTAMRHAMKDHALSLLMSTPTGAYDADVQVRIADSRGRTVLATRAGGPFCLIDLPRGHYTVQATQKGQTLTHPVHLAGKPVTVPLTFRP